VWPADEKETGQRLLTALRRTAQLRMAELSSLPQQPTITTTMPGIKTNQNRKPTNTDYDREKIYAPNLTLIANHEPIT